MTAPFLSWTVLPHGRLTPLTDDIMTVVGDIHMPIGEFPRRMTVVRLRPAEPGARRDLVIFSAMALDDDQMEVLEAFGRPAWMVVPSDRHRLDAPAWKKRYPNLRVICPPGARAKVEAVVPVNATAASFGDPKVRFVDVPGAQGNDAALEVHGSDGLTLIVNEIIGNIHGVHGLKGALLHLMGFAGDQAQIPAPVRMTLRQGKAALALQLRTWAAREDLKRIVVSHGDIIHYDPQGVLRTLAAELD